jgi:mannose-6-phosphate isomerase-like protein (cupin superfamily)
MTAARHPRPAELEGVSLEEIMDRYVARFRDRAPDWEAFEDARYDGRRRAQHRFIGAGGSGKHDDPNAIPARAHTLSIIYLPPGQTSPAHTHEVEETFFVLRGLLDVFVEDETGRRVTTRLGPWECICSPPGVIHGFENTSLEPVWFQVMLGKGRPDGVGYADEELYRHRNDHLKAS